MGEGIRVFGDDFAFNFKGGSSDASSRASYAKYAFDNLDWSRWYSDGDNTDGDAIYLERTFASERLIDSGFIYTNISDLTFQYWDISGSAWVDIDGTNTELLASKDNYNSTAFTLGGKTFITVGGKNIPVDNAGEQFYFFRLTTPVVTTKLRAIGSETLPADVEKVIKQFNIFLQVGQFEYRSIEMDVKILEKEEIQELDSGFSFAFKKGRDVNVSLIFTNHANQNDINLKNYITVLDTPLFLWKCGGNEAQFKYLDVGHRFQDLYKLIYIKGHNPILRDKRYNLAGNDSLGFTGAI